MNNSEKTYYKLIEEYPNSPKLGTILYSHKSSLPTEVDKNLNDLPNSCHYISTNHLDTKFYEKSLKMSEDGYPLFNMDMLYYHIVNTKLSADEICSRYYMKHYLIQSNVKYFKIKENCEKYVASLKPILPKSWYNLPSISGYYVDGDDAIVESYNSAPNKLPQSYESNTCKTNKQALSQIAFAKLTQLASEMNGDWVADFNNIDTKWCVDRYCDALHIDNSANRFLPICFKNRELVKFSFDNHSDLWKQYYQLN